MLTSELLYILQQNLAEHGDIPVLVEQRGMGGYAIHTIDSTDIQKISPYDIEEEVTNECYKEVFLEWDGNEDISCISSQKYLELKLGSMLYAT